MAISASKSSLSAIALSATAISSAPGTVTCVMCRTATPSAASSSAAGLRDFVGERSVEACLHDADDATRRHRAWRPVPCRRIACASSLNRCGVMKPVTSRPVARPCWACAAGCRARVMRRDAEIAQDLRADAVGAQVHRRLRGALRGRGHAGWQLREQRGGVARAVEQHRYAARAALQRLQRARQRPRVAASGDVEQVHRGERFVHAHQHFVALLPAGRGTTPDAGRRLRSRIREAAKAAIRAEQIALAAALDQDLVVAAVMRSGRRWCRSSGRASARTPRRSGRRAMVPSSFMISQITAAGVRPAMRGQIAAGLGVAGAHQHAAVLRLQRERCGRAARGRWHAPRAPRRPATVRARSAAEMPVVTPAGGLDRHREGGAVRGAVAGRHRRQLQALAALAGQRQADQAAAVLGHEVDRLGA